MTAGVSTEEAVRQLADAVDYYVGRAEMYGLAERRRDPQAFARQVVAELASADPQLAGEASLTVVEWVAGPTGECVWPPGWWQTPLGRLVAHTRPELLDDPDVGGVPVETVCEVLGISRQHLYRLVDAGDLEHVARGAVSAASVAREARRRTDSPHAGHDR